MKQLLLKSIILMLLLISCNGLAAPNNIDQILTPTEWNALFPKRAGTTSNHPQGYNSDFYALNHFKTAINEMSDYLVEIRKKPGVWGELTTITKKSTGTSYNYSDVESWWHNNPTQEVIITVDFADFVNKSSTINNKRELAAFLANISKETTGGWQLPVGQGTQGDYASWGLYFVHEVGYNSTNGAGTYSQASTEYPPNPAVGYYGRGPIQLSWNYNYGQFSKFLYNDVNVLLNNPDLIQQDGVLAFKSAIWFWMMPQCPKPSCHQVMHNTWMPMQGEYTQPKMYKKGFSHTNNIINGGLECRTSSSNAFTEKVVLRSELYKYYLTILGFSSAEIAAEDTGEYTTLCYENTSNAMEDYLSCENFTLSIESSNMNNFTIAPNPVEYETTITHDRRVSAITIFSITGEKVYSINPASKKFTLSLDFLTSGIYIMQLQTEKKIQSIKIVKR